MLDSHLAHMRVLVLFLSIRNPRPDDVLAVDYFHDLPDTFEPLDNKYLNEWVDHVGGWMVHITKKPMPTIKSNQEYPIGMIASKLVPPLRHFLTIAPEGRLRECDRVSCLNHLAIFLPPEEFNSLPETSVSS